MNWSGSQATRHHLSSVYQRVKKNCCEEWKNSRSAFYEWYENRVREQDGKCVYCGLPGDTEEYYYQHFRPDKDGRCKRGFYLEVDRRAAKEPYSPQNCVLACYPCNNAKSDVFSHDEFLMIGKVIGQVKKQEVFQGDQ